MRGTTGSPRDLSIGTLLPISYSCIESNRSAPPHAGMLKDFIVNALAWVQITEVVAQVADGMRFPTRLPSNGDHEGTLAGCSLLNHRN